MVKKGLQRYVEVNEDVLEVLAEIPIVGARVQEFIETYSSTLNDSAGKNQTFVKSQEDVNRTLEDNRLTIMNGRGQFVGWVGQLEEGVHTNRHFEATIQTNTENLERYGQVLGSNIPVGARFEDSLYRQATAADFYAGNLLKIGSAASVALSGLYNLTNADIFSNKIKALNDQASPDGRQGGASKQTPQEVEAQVIASGGNISRALINNENQLARVEEENAQHLREIEERGVERVAQVKLEGEERVKAVRDAGMEEIRQKEQALIDARRQAEAAFQQARVDAFTKNLNAVEGGEDSTFEERVRAGILSAKGATADAIRDELVASGVVNAEQAAEAWARTMRDEGGKAISDALASGDLVGTLADAQAELERQIAEVNAGTRDEIDLTAFGVSEEQLKKFTDAHGYAMAQTKAQEQELRDFKMEMPPRSSGRAVSRH